MKRILHIAVVFLLTVMLVAGVLPQSARAAEEVMQVQIPIQMEVTGSAPVSGAYAEFLLSAVTEGAPMPEGASEGSVRMLYPLTQKGANSAVLEFEIPSVGVYEYTLQMVGGTYYHPEDGSVYSIEAYNLTNGYDDALVVSYVKDGVKEKGFPQYIIPLRNVYTAKQWIDTAFPGSLYVDIALQLDGKPVKLPVLARGAQGNAEVKTMTVEPVRLYDGNKWQGSWQSLDARAEGSYSVQEENVPSGFHDSYREVDGVHIVSNTRSLRQTGQLNWPIPVLAVCGMFFLGIGAVLLRRKEEEYD